MLVSILHIDTFICLSKAYFGGHVDMYIPNNSLFDSNVNKNNYSISLVNKVFHYDINSLYPTGMKLLNLPVGKISHFIPRTNDSLALLSKDYKLGIFRVNLIAPSDPKDLNHPIVPIKIDYSCVYPIGNWEGWYSSEELVNAERFGYTYDILEGYLFESAPIFKDYIDKLYNIKQNSEKDSPKYIISKLLMNSLYGRFAMDPHLLNHEIVNKIDHSKPYEDILELNEYLYLITYYNEKQNHSMNINIAIGYSVTAYARIIMSEFKKNPLLTGKVYYTDTDSLFCNKELPSNYIGKELGKMKLEHILTRFISLGPKVYGGINTNGIEFTKVKGLKKKISFKQLEDLLKPFNKIQPFQQEKWYKSLIECTIEIKQIPYLLTPTDNKRHLIYKNNILIGTKAIQLKDGIKLNEDSISVTPLFLLKQYDFSRKPLSFYY